MTLNITIECSTTTISIYCIVSNPYPTYIHLNNQNIQWMPINLSTIVSRPLLILKVQVSNNNGISCCYYLVVVSYYLITHNNIYTDKRPPLNRGRSRGGRGGMALNNNSMCDDERLRVGACASRSSPPTKTMKSGMNSGGGYTGVGNENDSPINSPDSKKEKGMFILMLCILFVYYLLFVFLILTINIPNIKNSTQ